MIALPATYSEPTMTEAERRIAGCPATCRMERPHLHRVERDQLSPFVRRAQSGTLPAKVLR